MSVMQLFRLAYFGRVREDLPKQEGLTKPFLFPRLLTAYPWACWLTPQQVVDAHLISYWAHYLLLGSADFRPSLTAQIQKSFRRSRH